MGTPNNIIMKVLQCSVTSYYRFLKRWGVSLDGLQTRTSYPMRRQLADYLKLDGAPITSHKLRLRLVREGLRKDGCEQCQLSLWQGKKIPLELDHINGNHFDNRIENLRILCRNCHGLTETFCSKNKKTYKAKINAEVLAAQHSKDRIMLPCKPQRLSKRITKIIWPTVEEMRALVWQQPLCKLSKILGVSDRAITKHCVNTNVLLPPQGYWNCIKYGKAPSEALEYVKLFV